MNRQYFDELELKEYPYPYNQEGYPEIDRRDTYSLNTTFLAWLYEHLRLFQNINCIATDREIFTVDGVELTFEDCLDRMIYDCGTMLRQDEVSYDSISEDLLDDLFKVLRVCFWALWW